MLNIFLHISGAENTSLAKDNMGIFQITIEAALFNLDFWLLIIIYNTNNFLNL